MEKELKDLKSVLRSIVVSSPAQVDVRSLQRDYKNMMGLPIPIAKHGYRDLLAFLKERCNDCFLFQGLPSNPVLTLIVPESLKHIDQFVRSQKPSAVTKIKGKRRSINETAYEKPNLICQTFNSNRVSTPHLKSHPVEKPPDLKKTPIKSTSAPTNNLYSRKDLTESAKSISNVKPDSGYLNCNADIVGQVHDNGDVRKFFKKRLPMYDSSQYLNREACSEPDKVSSKGDDSGRQTSSSQSSTKKAQLEELKCEIHDLIKEHEEGIWTTDLVRLYRERHGRELNFNRFGHNNINSLLCAMEDRVTFSSEARGVRLRDAAREACEACPAPPVPRARFAPRPPSLRALPVDPDDALPGIDFEPDVFPADCMHFMESIPALSLGELQAGAMLEVTVGEVYSPSHFWLQRLGEQYNLALDDVMDEMSEYYTAGSGRARVLARGAVRPGHYCSSVYERDWHRSLIVKVLDVDTVKVRHVDYGTVDTVATDALKPLLRRWARLPAQALRARLAGLRPGAGGRRWPHAAAAHFLQLVRDRRLVACVVAVDPEEDTIETFLIDTSGADDVCLTAEMIRSGHADERGDSALRTAECYLYPRFDALESGDTPNFGEIHRYLADGISLEFVEAYRRHVPSVLPAPSPAPLEVLNRVPLLRRAASSPPPERRSSTPRTVSANSVHTTVSSTLRATPAGPDATAPSAAPVPTPAPVPTTAPVPAARPSLSSTPALSAAPAQSAAFVLSAAPAVSAATAFTAMPAVSAAHTFSAAPCVSAAHTFSVAPARSAEQTFSAAPTKIGAPSISAAPALLASPAVSAYTFPAAPAVFAAPVLSAAYGTEARGPRSLAAPPAAPPRPRTTPPRPGEVRLSAQECELYTLLSALDPAAAHCYMLSALHRAGSAPRPFPLNPHAAPFRPPGTPPPSFTRPPGTPPPSFTRPPGTPPPCLTRPLGTPPPCFTRPPGTPPPSVMRPPPGF